MMMMMMMMKRGGMRNICHCKWTIWNCK